MSLWSIALEKHTIGGILQNPEVLADVDSFLSEKDFYIEPHNVIYSCLRQLILANERPDKVLLAQKIKNLGISFKEGINIFDYIGAITFAPITAKATLDACKEVVKLRALRNIENTGKQIQSYVTKSANDPLDKTISEIDSIYGEINNFYVLEDRPVNLFEGLVDLAEERGNNPKTEVGLSTPFPEFNRLYSGIRNKNLYVIAARAKAGKSTFLVELSSEISKIHKVPVLYADSEQSSEEVKFRTIAAKTGVPIWHIETGSWRLNKEYVEKIRNYRQFEKDYQVYHYYIGNKTTEQFKSLVRRWYLKHAKNKQGVICYDYVKSANEAGNRQEYQLMGDKIDALKKLAEELDCPIITAVQTNRSGITTGKDSSEIIDDESTVGISDRITWYSSFVAVLRRKSIDEILLDTQASGTHKFIPLVNRFGGRDATGHQDLILRTFPDGKRKYVKDYLNFEISNFKVSERGSLIHSIERQNAQFLLQDPERDRENTL